MEKGEQDGDEQKIMEMVTKMRTNRFGCRLDTSISNANPRFRRKQAVYKTSITRSEDNNESAVAW